MREKRGEDEGKKRTTQERRGKYKHARSNKREKEAEKEKQRGHYLFSKGVHSIHFRVETRSTLPAREKRGDERRREKEEED